MGLIEISRPQVRKVAEENGVDVSESIRELEERAKQVSPAEWTTDTPTLRSLSSLIKSSSIVTRIHGMRHGTMVTHQQ